ncbi:uncharacterized protein ACN427_013343 [Glossina fuscipes fuscipes]
MEEVKNIDTPEEKETIVDIVFKGSPEGGDDKKKTIVDIIFKDFSASPFNIYGKNPKKTYSNEFREKAKLDLLYDSTLERKASDRGSYDIEKEATYNVNETLLPSNQFKTEISNNYDLDEDDDDIFASISTQDL